MPGDGRRGSRHPKNEQLELPAELLDPWLKAPVRPCWDWQRKFLIPDEDPVDHSDVEEGRDGENGSAESSGTD